MMKRTFAFTASLALAIAFPLQAGQFKFGHQTLTVPDGFEVELVAGTNLVKRPVSMDYDEQGRLYVTDSSGSSEKGPKQLEEKTHRILRLEDTDGDGKFDKTVVFADKVMFPEGCLWYDGSLYVAAPPSIWKFTDADGDGVAEKREEWHEGKTLTGCANDLHGPYLGPDGFIYWCKGAFSEQNYEVNGKPFKSRAAHIFRARPDHSRLEPVLTGGMDNPVGVGFSKTGERFLAGTFFEPHIPGKRDGVIHAIYGGIYGKPHDVFESHKKTGELMPIMIHLGPSASCSVIDYKSEVLGKEFKENLFVCNFNLHSVTRHVLTEDGATFKTVDSSFLSSDDPDFHPTCVLEDADGSLLVVDTGGWYKICCPTSQLYKPDVLGAIYRIKRKAAPAIEDARGLKMDWAKLNAQALAKLLSDPRSFVVEHAMQSLAKQKVEAVSALADVVKSSPSAEARCNAVWTLARIDDAKARAATLPAFQDKDQTVVMAAVQSASLWRDAHAAAEISKLNIANNPHLQRIAAEYLGRISSSGGVSNDSRVAALLNIATSGPVDRVLEHSIAYALIEIDAPELVQPWLSKAPAAQRIAMIALDQMDHGSLKAEEVTRFLISTNVALKETAGWVVNHHPEWGGTMAGVLKTELAKPDLKGAERNDLVSQLSQLASSEAIRQLIGNTLETGTKLAQLAALQVVEQIGFKYADRSWGVQLARLASGNDLDLTREAVAAAEHLSKEGRVPELNAALLQIAKGAERPTPLRIRALAGVRGSVELENDLFNFLQDCLQPTKPVAVRSGAITVLVRAKLAPEQMDRLAETLKTTGPMETSKLLAVFEHGTNEALGLKIVANLKEAKALKSLRAETLKQYLGKYPGAVQGKLDELIATLNVDAAKQSARVNEVLASLQNGDIRRGQMLFNSPKASCSSCHAIGYGGGHVGPDLTRIGQVRTERDLVEAILYPSASFVRSFEPMIVTTKNDEEFSGVVKKDAADEVVLVTGPNAEARIARADIVEMRPGTVSVMPQGLDEQLTKQEFADLVAFLKATRW